MLNFLVIANSSDVTMFLCPSRCGAIPELAAFGEIAMLVHKVSNSRSTLKTLLAFSELFQIIPTGGQSEVIFSKIGV